MTKKQLTGGASIAALCALIAAPALAQDEEAPERIVVTGSLIRGTPVDAALPVEVFTTQELEETGNPTTLDFVKDLTISGPTTGEGYYFGGAGLNNNVGFNIRGIGADKTLTLLNGRRVAENAAAIPSAAIGRIEILKDGAAVTYGADATGGVVNFITRESFEGFEASASYMAIDGSDGDWSMSLLGGFGQEETNFMFSVEWDHRSELDTTERDFSSLPYGVNPAPWSTLTNLAGWLPRSTLPAEPTFNPNAVPPDSLLTGDWGTVLSATVSDFTQDSCEAVGGIFVNAFSCAYGYAPYYDLVFETETYRAFAQVNTTVNENMDFHIDAFYSQIYTPYAYGSPAQPVIRGTAVGPGAAHQFYVPMANPNVAEFVDRTGFDQRVFPSGPLAGVPVILATQGFTAITYRAFAHGGNETMAETPGNFSVPSRIDNQYWRVSSGINGELPGRLSGVGYDFAATYGQTIAYADSPDIIAYRLQEALNGFGGPSCNAPDLDPVRFGTQNPAAAGTDGCMWWNPFASGWAGQPVLGLANPNHVPGTENPDELVRWIFNDRAGETVSSGLTFDLVFDGATPIELPGGPVSWAAGTQWRQTEIREFVTDPLYNGNQPCPWPNDQGQVPLPTDHLDFNGCTPDEPGPFVFFGTDIPEYADQQQFSYFGELSIPLLDSLYLTAAVRHEDFSGGLGETVYKVSGKWDVTDNLAFRGAYGTNYQAPPAGLIPGEVNNGVNSYTIAGGNWRGATTITRSDVVPETATVWSTGAIWQSQGFTSDSELQVFVDYFDIETEDELGLLASANDVAEAVFSLPGGFADCSHPLVGRVTFNGGSCVQGVSNALEHLANVTTDFGNGPGQHTAGFDIQVNYLFPLFEGDVRLGVTGTNVTKFEFTPTILDGFVIDEGDDRLGTLNFATIANAAPEWRANFNANYSLGPHNFRFVLNYVSGVDDERFVLEDGSVNEAALTPAGLFPGTASPFGPSFYGVFGEDWVSGDFHYQFETPWDATISASIANITDEDPPGSRQELGYDPRIGNPLGRTFEIGVRKRF